MARELSRDYARALIPPREAGSHKGSFGHLLIIAGSRGFTGAVKLCCDAAGRSGAGLVTAAIPHPLGDIVAANLREAMTHRLPATEAETLAHNAFERALDFARDKDAVALGPGISRNPETTHFVLDFIPHCPVPLLVDADGLNAVSEAPDVLNETRSPVVLTPHPGEMARIQGIGIPEVQANREKQARALADRTGAVVVLKGHGTLVAVPGEEAFINPTGNHGMATGGTGDVLTGLMGGLLAQGVAALDAACLGVYLHGLAGDIATERLTARAMMAGDITEALPEAWHRLEET
jgi:ADP-dependent NAD(P)H-hydrate dehydratase / NAD(P)H-hydrate epimerase